MRVYSLAERIKDDSPLANAFNSIEEVLGVLRTFSSPFIYSDYRKAPKNAHTFYELCLLEIYMHSTISTLKRWVGELEKYNETGDWRSYAFNAKTEMINEYGAEEDELDENGNAKTWFTDEELKYATIKETMTLSDMRDIVRDTKPHDFNPIYTLLQNSSSFDFFKAFEKITGAEIPVYQKDGNGELKEMSFADKVLNGVSKSHKAGVLADVLFTVVTAINKIFADVKKKPYNQDHQSFYKQLAVRVDDLLNLKIELVELPKPDLL